MLLTQEEAKKWAEILKGFSEGKSYQIPFSFNDKGEVTRYIPITDFEVNPQCPTISITYTKGFELIRPETIVEVKKDVL